jgi:membrane associated rhomboid family serine protease
MSAQDLRERFFATPLVTRSLAASAWASVVLNVVTAGAFDDLVCASPHDIVRRGQVWRLVTSVLYVPGVISALFLSFILYRVCSGWERERGSLRMAHYFLLGVVGANAATALLAVLLAPFAPSLTAHTYVCAPGLQSALFVLCARIALGYPGPGVNLFGRSDLFVAAKRIPLLLFAAFVVFGAHPVEAAAAVGVGVLWARGGLRSVTPSDARLQQLERARALRRVVAARGYVSCAAAGPTMPLARAPADPTARGFLQHVREHAFAFEDETASDASRGNAGGREGTRGDGGRRLGRGADTGAGAPPPRPFAPEAGGGPSGGGDASPGNPWGRQNVHLSTPPRADPDPAPAPAGSGPRGGAGGREKTREPKPEASKKPELSREERAAAFASAAEKRRSQPEQDERGGGSGGGAS